jgi:ribosomal protein S18 acetylase RimI-like enzyme
MTLPRSAHIIARMVRIRPAGPADGPPIASVRAETWRVAYAGVIPAQRLAELTAPEAVARDGVWRAGRSMDGVLVAEAGAAGETGEPGVGEQAAGELGAGEQGAPAVGDDGDAVIGFAAFGPERDEDYQPGQPLREPPEHRRAELYGIYVLPSHWSTGAGRALMDGVLSLTEQAGYTDISLWVLEVNIRARRFYEKAGFRLTGESGVLRGLPGVTQVRYRRAIS